MYCKHCGNEIKQGQKFCGKCGAAQVEPQANYLEHGSTTQGGQARPGSEYSPCDSKPPKKRKSLIVAIVALFVAVICCVVIFIVMRPIESGVNNSIGSYDGDEKIIAIDTSGISIDGEDDAREVITDAAPGFGFANAESQLGECRVDEIFGDTYYRFGQEYEGIPVYGRAMVLDVNGAGATSVLSNGFVSMDGANSTQVLDEAEARDACREMVGEGSDPRSFGLIYYATDGKKPELCYRFSISEDGFAGYYFISAASGRLVCKENLLCEITGSGKDISKKKREFEISTDEMSDDYVLEDAGRKIRVYDAKQGSTSDIFSQIFLEGHGGSKYYLYPTSTDGDNEWFEVDGGQATIDMEPLNVYDWTITKSNGISDTVTNTKFGYASHLVKSKDTSFSSAPAVTLMYNLSQVHDFYAQVLKRNGFDGKGGNVEAVFNVKEDNAFGWAPVKTYANVIIGMPGNKTEYLELPVIGHEFTHAVQSSICNLGTSENDGGEAGALKEATSDIFGVLICDYADNGKMDGSSSWVLSGRNLVDPEKSSWDERDGAGKEHPSRYQDQKYWGDTSAEYDGGYAHNNSTVISHAAYLMGSGNLAGEALTNEDIGRIHLAAFHLISESDCDFALYAGYVIRKATDLLPAEKAERVAAAYEAVNINPVMVVYIDGNSNDTGGDASRDSRENRYAAYLQKVEEYQSQFGEGKIENANYGNVKQMKGLCLVDLIDFDNDGDEELLLGYYDESQANYYASDNFADAQAYRAEIWGYENGNISKLYESDFQWTNGGFAYLPVYKRSSDVAMYTVEYGTDSDNRSVGTSGIWVLKGNAFEEITTFSTYGMWGTGEVEYEIDGQKVDESAYKTHFDDVMGDHTTTSYWMTWNDGSSHEAEHWDTLNTPADTLAITNDTIAKLRGEQVGDHSQQGANAGVFADKIHELVSTYGEPSVATYTDKHPNGDVSYTYSGVTVQAEGLCYAKLVDFDKDGTDELLTICYDPTYPSNAGCKHEQMGPEENMYRVDVWDSTGEGLVQLCSHNLTPYDAGIGAYLYETGAYYALQTCSYDAKGNTETFDLLTFENGLAKDLTEWGRKSAYYAMNTNYFVDGANVGESVYRTHPIDFLGGYTFTLIEPIVSKNRPVVDTNQDLFASATSYEVLEPEQAVEAAKKTISEIESSTK